MRKVFLLLLILSSFSSAAQKYTISGTVNDFKTGEALIGVYISDSAGIYGTVTNNYGYYSLTLPKKIKQVHFNYVGYNTVKKDLIPTGNIVLDIELKESDAQIEEVTVTGQRADKNINNAETGVITFTPKDIKIVPVIFGE